ncbi:alpha/beta hydrolase [Robinsoniella peoriensis]
MSIKVNKIILNETRNVSLTTMILGVEEGPAKRPAVLILPGGGYETLADGESETIAYSFLNAGFHAFVLRYSVAEHKAWPNPLEDYECAMKLIRSRAEEWNIAADKVAVIGFSAGGHLAACAATISVNRPNAAILGYAATGRELCSLMSTETAVPVPNECVDMKTCPCFLISARDDTAVPVNDNTVKFEQALSKYGIQFECHIYAYGGHGFSNGEKSVVGTGICSRVRNWQKDSIEWLWDIFGILTPQGFEQPKCKAKINGDYEDHLSIDCTMGYLKKQSEQVLSIIEPIWNKLQMFFPHINNPDTLDHMLFSAGQLSRALEIMHVEQAEVDRINSELQQMKNKLPNEFE